MNNTLDDLKEWVCPKGHLLGLVKRVKTNAVGGAALHVSRLLLFRQAVDRTAAHIETVDVIAAVEGTALNIRCSVCGEVRPWYIGQDALERLLDRIGGSHANQAG